MKSGGNAISMKILRKNQSILFDIVLVGAKKYGVYTGFVEFSVICFVSVLYLKKS